MNTILGGAFTSRLNLSLRERHGFTYGARSGFAFRRRPGPFIVQAAVATEVTARAVEEALKEMTALRDEGASDKEVASARDYLRGILPLQLQTTGQLASRLADLVIFDLPDDYFQQYRQRIADVSPEDVHRVAGSTSASNRLAIVIVGDAKRIFRPRILGIGTVVFTKIIDGLTRMIARSCPGRSPAWGRRARSFTAPDPNMENSPGVLTAADFARIPAPVDPRAQSPGASKPSRP